MKKVVFRVVAWLNILVGGYIWLIIATLLALVNHLYANKYFTDPGGHMQLYEKASNLLIDNYIYVIYFSGICVVALLLMSEISIIQKIISSAVFILFVLLHGNIVPVVENVVNTRMVNVQDATHIGLFATLVGIDVVFIAQELLKNILGINKLQPMKQETYELAVATSVDDVMKQYLDRGIDFDAAACDRLIKKYGGYNKDEFTE